MKPKSVDHGSDYAYRHGCRCSICAKANYARFKKRKERDGGERYRANQRRFYRKNSARYAAKQREYTRRNPSARLRRLYGITIEDYNTLLAAQNNVCAVCSRPFSETGTLRPVVDHSHSTSEVRGILHDGCNRGLGSFEENETYLLGAIAYLTRKRAG